MEFKYCFSRNTAFAWFAIIVMGLMIRSDQMGLTSIVRELNLTPASYMAMLHFFRSKSWHIERIKSAWVSILKKLPCLIMENDRYILIADGVKQTKEGKKMPGVKKLHQESENSAKGEYIYGHLFGGLGILAGNAAKQYSILISARLHEGLRTINKWRYGKDYNEESHVVKMVREAINVAARLGRSILLLDRLYLTIPMLETLGTSDMVEVVTKAKMNASAYYDPKPKTGKGPKPKKGESVKVADLFSLKAAEFISMTMTLYGKDKDVRFFCIDLLWGKGRYQRLRFVLTEMDNVKSILVSTDLTLTPQKIIQLYCYRFKIECSFRELKQVIAGFCYHFWSKAMPKLNRYKNNDANQIVLESITDPEHQTLIKSTVSAIEGYVQLSCIALGLLQIIGLLFSDTIVNGPYRFMRSKSNAIPSEATVADYLRKNIYMQFRFFEDLPLIAIIKKHQMPPPDTQYQSLA